MSSNSFSLGQRWISNTETDLGLGTVVAISGRTLDILFPATGETRVYSHHTAPLTRVSFDVEDEITSHEGWSMVVESVTEENGLLAYTGKRCDTQAQVVLVETHLDHHFQLDQPEQRLFAGQVDDPKWFDLRRQAFSYKYDHATSPLLGMLGARVDLIAHQLHIASEVGQRHAPRVLLADEVGLGKTVEAALIIHQQLLTQRASRVLIVVPSSLVHQWLVEMLRRVNLAFSIYDEDRCQSMGIEEGNPFEAEQLVLCSLDFLTHNSKYYQQALEAEWDLLVVDEAHHLTWEDGQASQEYQVVEGLAQAVNGVLLLTATPDQLGHESHFARLRLLDPARFHSYQTFLQEERNYTTLASAIDPLLSGKALPDSAVAAIQPFLAAPLSQADLATDEQRQSLLSTLLDQHGTGRVLFRNSRAGIEGFPERILSTYPLNVPQPYQELWSMDDTEFAYHLTPEHHPAFVDMWWQFDPRVGWLAELLKRLRDHKVLTICAKASTALMLSEALRVQTGIRAAVFHEGMSIVERDKAANYFAQDEDGAQILICSEIGSEGRNFQFAHHLVLFDLPLLPDLLEQRIGRLDRIGQRHDIQIHLPYFSGSAQHVLVDWYHQGLNAFERTCPVGTAMFEQTGDELITCLMMPSDTATREALLDKTQSLYQQLMATLEQGRDKLLELNSSGKGRIEGLVNAIKDADENPRLEMFMTRLFDAIGIAQEEKDDVSYILRPTESMLGLLPGFDEEGTTITYEREAATQLEHIQYLSWDHPMVHHGMDMIITDVHGKSAVGLAADKSLPAGMFWVECLFILSNRAQTSLQLERFLPPTPVRICIDGTGAVTSALFGVLQTVNNKTATQLIGALRDKIENALTQARNMAEQQADTLRQESLDNMHDLLGAEHSRLLQLREVNPSIRDDELAHILAQKEALDSVIREAKVHFEAVRLVVNNP